MLLPWLQQSSLCNWQLSNTIFRDVSFSTRFFEQPIFFGQIHHMTKDQGCSRPRTKLGTQPGHLHSGPDDERLGENGEYRVGGRMSSEGRRAGVASCRIGQCMMLNVQPCVKQLHAAFQGNSRATKRRGMQQGTIGLWINSLARILGRMKTCCTMPWCTDTADLNNLDEGPREGGRYCNTGLGWQGWQQGGTGGGFCC